MRFQFINQKTVQYYSRQDILQQNKNILVSQSQVQCQTARKVTIAQSLINNFKPN